MRVIKRKTQALPLGYIESLIIFPLIIYGSGAEPQGSAPDSFFLPLSGTCAAPAADAADAGICKTVRRIIFLRAGRYTKGAVPAAPFAYIQFAFPMPPADREA